MKACIAPEVSPEACSRRFSSNFRSDFQYKTMKSLLMDKKMLHLMLEDYVIEYYNC